MTISRPGKPVNPQLATGPDRLTQDRSGQPRRRPSNLSQDATRPNLLNHKVGSGLKVVEGVDELLVVDHDSLTHTLGLESIVHALVGRDILFQRGARHHSAHRPLRACRPARPGEWRCAAKP